MERRDHARAMRRRFLRGNGEVALADTGTRFGASPHRDLAFGIAEALVLHGGDRLVEPCLSSHFIE